MGATTITVSEETLARFKQLKEVREERAGHNFDVSSDTFMNGLMAAWEDQNDVEAVYQQGSEEPAEMIHTAPSGECSTDELMRELKRTQELVERVPEDTAEALGERFA